MDAYEIIVAPEAAPLLRALTQPDLANILLYLDSTAAAASLPLDAQKHERLATRLHHGLHRAALGTLWIVFRVNHEHHRVTLISISERDVRPPSTSHARWSNEGGQ